ncbi:uncharacterized protein [Lolium perenne]|uniref:uncharacterized protein n=1 Tax=Lolium perenne TaxID=4522 RepID=UPI003A99429A
MAPNRNAAGYTGVRPRRSGMFSAEIRAAGVRQYLGTFPSAYEAARAYDAAAWVLGRPRHALNFEEVWSLEEALSFADPSADRLVTDEERRRHRHIQRQIRIAEEDERAMEAWRLAFPEDVILKEQFFARKREEREAAWAERRARREDRRERHRAIRARRDFAIEQVVGVQTISWDDPRINDMQLSSPSATSASSGDDSESSFDFGDYP